MILKNLFSMLYMLFTVKNCTQSQIFFPDSLAMVCKTGYLSLSSGCFADIEVTGEAILQNVSCQSLTVYGCVKLENCKIKHLNVQGCVSICTSVILDASVTGSFQIHESVVDDIVIQGDLSVDNGSIKNIDYTGFKICLSKSFVAESIVVHTPESEVPSIVLDDVLILGTIRFDSSQLGLVQMIGQNSYVCSDKMVNSKIYRMTLN